MSSTLTVTGPAISGAVLTSRKSATVWLSPRQHIVQIGHWVANTIYLITRLCERKCFEHVCAALCFDERVAVNLGCFYRSAESAPGVEPGTIPDAIACADSWLARPGLRAEIGSPRAMARTRVGRQSLAVCVCSCQTTQITAVSNRLTGDEEAHWNPPRHAVLRCGRMRDHNRQNQDGCESS